MLEREAIVQEFWRRCTATPDVCFTSRNPKDNPSLANMPCIEFFELDDEIESTTRRGGLKYPDFRRRLKLEAELYLVAVSEGSSSKELGLFVNNFKKTLYVDGVTLGGLCLSLEEKRTGRILRPPVGGPVVGVGIAFEIRYVEDVGKLFL